MDSLPIIIAFYEQIDIFMLILVRVLAFFIFLPVISGMAIPMQARLLLGFVMAVAIFSTGQVTAVAYPETQIDFFILILVEFLVGLGMGFMIHLIFSALLLAGHLIDFMMGFAMTNVMDPLLQIQVPIVGNLMFMTVMALLITSGGLMIFMHSFVLSFGILPLGTALFLDNLWLQEFIILQVGAFMLLAVRISLPVVGALTVINAALGIMVKAVQGLNVFIVGIPLKIVIGFLLLIFIMAPAMLGIFDTLFWQALYAMEEFIWYIHDPEVIPWPLEM